MADMRQAQSIRGRWFQFGIATMLAAATVVGLLAGWLVNNYRYVQKRHAFWERFNDGDYSLQSYALLPPEEPRPVSWIRKMTGDFSCGTLMYRAKEDADGSQLRTVQTLFPEASIWAWPHERHLPPGIKALDEDRPIGDFVPPPDDPRAGL